MPDLTAYLDAVRARLVCPHHSPIYFDLEQFCRKCQRAAVNLLEEAVADLARLERLARAALPLEDYAVEHSRQCILSYWEAGEPTPDGKYRMKYKGVWYDEPPKCECGLSDALAHWQAAVQEVEVEKT